MNKESDRSFLLSCLLYFILFFCLCSCSGQKSEPVQTSAQSGGGIISKPSGSDGPKESIPLSPPTEEAENGPKVLSKNEPKVDKARFVLETVNGTDRLKVAAEGSDNDGNKVSLRFQWTKNAEPAGEGDTISGFKRGDKISVMITPFDDLDEGLARSLTTEIRNTSPSIIEHQGTNFDGKAWSYQIKATDPDGDPLTYSLKSAPLGMTIDSSTGLIKWNVPAGFTGKAPFTVSVADGHGGEASQSFTVDIKPSQKK